MWPKLKRATLRRCGIATAGYALMGGLWIAFPPTTTLQLCAVVAWMLFCTWILGRLWWDYLSQQHRRA